MSYYLKSTVQHAACIILLFACTGPGTVDAFMEPDDLILADKGLKIENSISIFISESEYESLLLKDGEKRSFENKICIINGDTVPGAQINTRGGSTLLFTRKSFSFSLKSEASFSHGKLQERFRRFYALSLSMDRNYRSNRLAFEMMEKARLTGLFYSFGEMRINDKCEGICMIVERPEDWALNKMNSPFIMRRGYNETIDKMEFSNVAGRKEANDYSGYFSQIYRSLKKYKGEDLYNKLSIWIDLDNYMKWLAFNFLVRNGDYTDEVFFYVDPGTKKFKVIPWDYDDLFLPAPHEGLHKSRKILGDKMIFSSEDKLDIVIAQDPFLYKKYQVQMMQLLDDIPDDSLRQIFENTYAELFPYFTNHEIIGMSRYDSHRETDLANLQDDLKLLFAQLVQLYDFYRNYLKYNI